MIVSVYSLMYEAASLDDRVAVDASVKLDTSETDTATDIERKKIAAYTSLGYVVSARKETV